MAVIPSTPVEEIASRLFTLEQALVKPGASTACLLLAGDWLTPAHYEGIVTERVLSAHPAAVGGRLCAYPACAAAVLPGVTVPMR